MVIDGIPTDKKETVNDLKHKIIDVVTNTNKKQDETMNEQDVIKPTKSEFLSQFDKCHRIGPNRDGRQAVIIKFRTHLFRERLYKDRNKNPRQIQIQSLLNRLPS